MFQNFLNCMLFGNIMQLKNMSMILKVIFKNRYLKEEHPV